MFFIKQKYKNPTDILKLATTKKSSALVRFIVMIFKKITQKPLDFYNVHLPNISKNKTPRTCNATHEFN